MLAGEHDLAAALVQMIEQVEELFLRTLLACQQLDIIEDEQIGRAKAQAPAIHPAFLHGRNQFIDERAGREAGHRRAGAHRIPEGVRQMRFPAARRAVYEQWIVSRAGLLDHGVDRSCRKLIGAAHIDPVACEDW